MHLNDLPTPAAVVDLAVVERNARWAIARARELGVRLRPHVKTHKCHEIAKRQAPESDPTIAGITVSTLAEAHYFVEFGWQDLTYAFPLAPARIDEVATLKRRVARLAVVIDQIESARELVAAAAKWGCTFDVFLKVDSGSHRAGVDPHAATGFAIAHELDRAKGITFRGILTHNGAGYFRSGRDALLDVARTERDVMLAFAARLRKEGLPVETISIGSTPSFRVIDSLTGITEARPGNFIFNDGHQVAIGSCEPEDVAMTVLATVVGRYPERGQVIIDAGALALSKDSGPRHVDPDCGYGQVLDLDGEALLGCRVTALSQEHGTIDVPGDASDRFAVGTRVRILPNHSCLTAACFAHYAVLVGSDIVDQWPVVRGW